MALEITTARPDPALLDLPWSVPLEEWPEDHLAALPRGISRHVVRFVKRGAKGGALGFFTYMELGTYFQQILSSLDVTD